MGAKRLPSLNGLSTNMMAVSCSWPKSAEKLNTVVRGQQHWQFDQPACPAIARIDSLKAVYLEPGGDFEKVQFNLKTLKSIEGSQF